MAASEAIPFGKTGGLGEVAGSLFRELCGLGIDVRLIMPLYRGIKRRFGLRDTGLGVAVPLGRDTYEFKIYSSEGGASGGSHPVIFLECEEFFNRREFYGTSHGDYEDNAHRFIGFSRAVLEACRAMDYTPDVIHANDWQTAVIPLYVKTLYKKRFKKTSTLLTIHNLGYQGIFPASAMTITGLDMKFFNPENLEFYGKVNLLKAGIVSADAVSTVSPNYAKEIKLPEYGFGLEGVLAGKDVIGITNGIDYDVWNPERDAMIPANYGIKDMSGKKTCRGHLLKECAFSDGSAPIAAMVGRIAAQKGIDILLDASIMPLGVNMVILGHGDELLQNSLSEVAGRHPRGFYFRTGYDDAFAHRIFAGSDIFLMPSCYEPCGIGQMIAMRYGTLPVARHTGGIADTVGDYDHRRGGGTGFLFRDHNASALEECLKRSLCLMADEAGWMKAAAEGMKRDFSWKSSALKYAALYESMMRRARG